MNIELKMYTLPDCVPCKMMKPTVDSISKEKGFNVTKFCIETNPELIDLEEIKLVPTVKIFKNGILVETVVGIKTKEVFEEIINNII